MLSHDKNLTAFYGRFLKRAPWKLGILFVMPLIWCSAETYAPYLVKNLLDNIIETPHKTSFFLTNAVIAYTFLMAIIEASLRMSHYLFIKILHPLKETIRAEALAHLQKKSLSFFHAYSSGSLLNSLKHIVESFEQLFLCFLYGIYPLMVTFFVTTLLIFNVSKILALFFVLWFFGMNIITFFFLSPTLQTADQYAYSESKLLGFIGDLLKNILLIKTFSSYSVDHAVLQQLQDKNTQKSLATEWVSFRADSLRGIISFLLLSLTFVFLVKGWQKNLITLGDFAFITTVCFYVRRSTWIAATYLLTFFKHFGIAKQSFKTLISDSKSTKSFGKILSESANRDILFQSVGFTHVNHKRIYEDFNLWIPYQQKIGITGASGTGKTTLIHLLLGLFEPDKGKIFLGGLPIQELDQEFLKTQISYVSQTAPLFHRSIFENIQYGNPNASDDDVIRAAKSCLCHSFISYFESAYQTIVGEEGVKLSGGQRQRIALARAYLKNAPILILDEATSALDFHTESRILDMFLKQDKTIVMISHRPSVFHKLDRLLFLEEGNILQDGPPQKVLSMFKT